MWNTAPSRTIVHSRSKAPATVRCIIGIGAAAENFTNVRSNLFNFLNSSVLKYTSSVGISFLSLVHPDLVYRRIPYRRLGSRVRVLELATNLAW